MKEKGGKHGEENLIDLLTITLSSSGTSKATYSGQEQIANVTLSYQMFCMNLENCPPPDPLPQS